MKYFIISLLIIFTVFTVHPMIRNNSPDHSVESGLQRSVPESRGQQSQEDTSIWDTQRENKNNVPRR